MSEVEKQLETKPAPEKPGTDLLTATSRTPATEAATYKKRGADKANDAERKLGDLPTLETPTEYRIFLRNSIAEILRTFEQATKSQRLNPEETKTWAETAITQEIGLRNLPRLISPEKNVYFQTFDTNTHHFTITLIKAEPFIMISYRDKQPKS